MRAGADYLIMAPKFKDCGSWTGAGQPPRSPKVSASARTGAAAVGGSRDVVQPVAADSVRPSSPYLPSCRSLARGRPYGPGLVRLVVELETDRRALSRQVERADPIQLLPRRITKHANIL